MPFRFWRRIKIVPGMTIKGGRQKDEGYAGGFEEQNETLCAPNLKGSMPKPRIMKMWLQGWDYEKAMDFSGKYLKMRQNYG